jgi:UrcA family protein
MLGRKTITTLIHLCGAVGAAAITLASAPAFAQAVTVEEVTVEGRPSKGPPETFDYRVGYSDLDLRTEEGRKELANRIQIAAAYACKKVDEPNGACRADAVSHAMVKARAAAHQMRGHGKHPAPGSPWVPPPA